MKYVWEVTDIQGGVVANERGDKQFTHLVVCDQEQEMYALVNFFSGKFVTKLIKREALAYYMTEKSYTPLGREMA